MPITYIGMIDRWIRGWPQSWRFSSWLLLFWALASILGCFQASC